MTSGLAVERRLKERHLFDCSCGATIETTGSRGTCWNCGERIEVRRALPGAAGTKYEIRVRKQRRTLSAESLAPPLPINFGTSSHRAHHQRNLSDRSEHFTRLGLKILLAPLYVPLLVLFVSIVFAPPPTEPQPGLIAEPEPTDCGLFSGCHYVKHTRYEKGYTIVTWERVTD